MHSRRQISTAGGAAAAPAAERGLSYVLLERTDHLADTIHCYQKRKHVMAEPSVIPMRGELPFAAGPREAILFLRASFPARSPKAP